MLFPPRIPVMHTLALLIFLKVVHCMPTTLRSEPNYPIGEVIQTTGTTLPNDFTDIKSATTIKQETSSSTVTLDGSEKHHILRFLAVERSSSIAL
ncbi:unnamed protein product [Rotaria socialis]|uniref:Uncharacterized protein n=1 Tax=Rotaria socialis TaxID=392032 RepID=A0A818HU42_9BILA|nr:unnamed protein product [Rotaria socialis]CAF4842016.1 unnamed protein product [Rotaria socialis]